jgi:hypothetical protein
VRRIGSRLLQGVALNRKAGESSIVAACQIDSEMVVIAVVGKKTKWSPLGSERKAELLAKRLRDVEVGGRGQWRRGIRSHSVLEARRARVAMVVAPPSA